LRHRLQKPATIAVANAYFCTMNFNQWVLYAAGAVALIQIVYYLIFFLRLAMYKAGTTTASQTHPVSVIICARDEAANLAKNLPGALVQQYRTTHEVLVVDDNSFDDTKYLLEELQKEFKQLQVINLKQEAKLIPGKKFPLSMGIMAAKHEVLLLTDADCVPASENWIEAMQEAYREGTEIVVGYGAYHKKPGLLNKLIRWETFHSALQYLSYALAKMPYMGVGRNLSYKKAVFFRHKGFTAHNHIPSGDDDLFINMAATNSNTRICINKESFTLSEPAATWQQWVRQKSRHYSTGRHYRGTHRFLLGLYALSHFLFYPLIAFAFMVAPWQWVLGIFGIRFVLQAIIYFRCMKKLGEQDLWGWFWLLALFCFII
jgi:glycosyltransferase involved in cell wall biosynthesis